MSTFITVHKRGLVGTAVFSFLSDAHSLTLSDELCMSLYDAHLLKRLMHARNLARILNTEYGRNNIRNQNGSTFVYGTVLCMQPHLECEL